MDTIDHKIRMGMTRSKNICLARELFTPYELNVTANSLAVMYAANHRQWENEGDNKSCKVEEFEDMQLKVASALGKVWVALPPENQAVLRKLLSHVYGLEFEIKSTEQGPPVLRVVK